MRIPFKFIAFLCLTLVAFADRKQEIGFLRLQSEVASLPTGLNLIPLQIEGTAANGAWAVAPDGQMTGKSIVYPFAYATPTLFSDHAKWVAEYYCGTLSSPIPNTPLLFSVSATDFIVSSLRTGMVVAPIDANWDTENHSWGYDGGTIGLDILRRLDWRIDHSGITVVCAVGNSGPVLAFPASAYNAISVGLTKGTHSQGGTTADGAGRQKPDLVGPENYTSNSSPIVASCAGLLIDKAKSDVRFGNARDPRVIKALLLAGATKEEIPTWTNSPEHPLDRIYGTGQVSIYHSYRILLAGQQTANTSWNAGFGWDKATSGANRYFIQVPDGYTMKFSVALVWHRSITPSANWQTLTSSLADLNLRLSSANQTFVAVDPIAESRSTLDNVEHIYLPNLPAGRYALDVVGPSGVTYGLAWRGDLTDVSAPLEIKGQPASQNIALGQSASLIVGVRGGSGTLAFQWRKSCTPIAGATSPMLKFPGFSANDQGSYDVIISDSRGTLTSQIAVLSLGAGQDSLLSALSARSQVNTDAAISIAGFVIPGSQPRAVLIRGLGPNLLNYGVPDSLSSPTITLYSKGLPVVTNDGWKNTDAAHIRSESVRLGAADLPEDGRDTAILTTLPPGPYSVLLSGKNSGTGVGMFEIFDAGTKESGRLSGLSTRAFVGTDSKVLISGLIISGSSPKTVLVTAIGPGLTPQSVPGVLAHPKLTVYADSQPIASNTDWNTAPNHDELLSAATRVQSTPLVPGRPDSALIVTLQPGAFTIHVSGADGATGIALAEVYELPSL